MHATTIRIRKFPYTANVRPAAWHGDCSSRFNKKELLMPSGSKSSYSNKQKRQAEHIEKGYEKRGTSKKEAERRAWATVNKETGGGKKSGSGRGKRTSHASSRKGGRLSHKSSK